MQRKQQQHQRLTEALTAAGWRVEVSILLFGVGGTCYRHVLQELQKLGLDKKTTELLLRRLHEHGVASLHAVVTRRRALERSRGRTGVG